MSIQGTNSHPYLTMDDAMVQERNAKQCMPVEVMQGLNGAIGTMASATAQMQTVGGFPYKPAELLPRDVSLVEMIERAKQNLEQQQPPKTTTALDRQVGGDHYKKMKIQPWELIDAMYPGEKGEAFYMGTAIAYFMRWKEKGGLEDIKKGIHTLEHFIENMESIK